MNGIRSVTRVTPTHVPMTKGGAGKEMLSSFTHTLAYLQGSSEQVCFSSEALSWDYSLVPKRQCGLVDRAPHWDSGDLGSSPTGLLGNFEQVTSPLWASVSPSPNGDDDTDLLCKAL